MTAEGPAEGHLPAATRITETLRQLAAESSLRLRVAGDCMSPMIRDGDFVEVVRDRFLLPGDVIAFQGPGGRHLVHRLVGYRWTGWRVNLQTRADGTGRFDTPISPAVVIGRVVGGRRPVVPSPAERLSWTARFAVTRMKEILRAIRRGVVGRIAR